MSVTYIVDGYNVIYKRPDLARTLREKGLAAARSALAGYLLSWKQRRIYCGFLIVFDGKDPEIMDRSHQKLQGIDCYFTTSKQEADNKIIALLRELNNPKETIVVSADNQVINACRVYGVEVKHPSFFETKKAAVTQRQSNDTSKNIPLSEQQKLTKWYTDELARRKAAG